MSILEKFRDYCNKNLLIQKNEKILLGVSGGPDSLTMLDLFSRIQNKFSLELYVFHLNHMFREEAVREAEFVKESCEKYNLKVFIKKIDVPALIADKGLSPEEAAREARFKFMEERANELNCKKIALAHHRDDHIETILFHIFRGSALKGLAGINPVTNYKDKLIIHPLLDINKYEIEKYCQKRGLEPCRDASNEETDYIRNKIRHKVIPYIEDEINPGFRKVIVRMADVLREEEEFLNQMAVDEMENSIIENDSNKIVLSIKYLRELASVMRRRVIQNVINELLGQVTDLYYEHLNTVDKFIIDGNTGTKIYLPHKIRIKRIYNKLIIKKGEFKDKEYKYNFKLEIPGEVNLPDGKKIRTKLLKKESGWLQLAVKDKTCFCDYQKIKEPLYIRTRKPGDKFQPLGMEGIKKLKDFFIDEKIPPGRRNNVPIIVDSNQIIIWIAGMRMNNKFKITEETEDILYIDLIL